MEDLTTNLFRETVEAFVLLFAILNVLPVLPVVLATTQELSPERRKKTQTTAVITVGITGAAFALAGGPMLGALGLGVEDLRIAGGLILLVFAVHDLLFARVTRKEKAQETDAGMRLDDDDDDVGIVPLGIPIVLGPAGMTALLVFARVRGPLPVLIAFALNLAINAGILFYSEAVRRRVGRPVIRGLGKVMGVMLAALGVSMIRNGVQALLA